MGTGRGFSKMVTGLQSDIYCIVPKNMLGVAKRSEVGIANGANRHC